MYVHLYTVIFSTAHVWLFECAVECWAAKCEYFIESITNAAECTASAIYDSVGVTRFSSVGIGLSNDLLWDFGDTEKDIRKSTS